jgi:hypothetical protein
VQQQREDNRSKEEEEGPWEVRPWVTPQDSPLTLADPVIIQRSQVGVRPGV